MKNQEHQLRSAAWQFAACALLTIVALLVWKLVYADVSEASMESRGIMLIRWHADEEPKLEFGGNIAFVPQFRKQGAEPLAILELTYWRRPVSNPVLAWLGLATDKSSSDLWFDDAQTPQARALFEADARAKLQASPWMMTTIHNSLLQHDGDSPSLRIIFFRRVPTLLLSIAAAFFLFLSARNLRTAVLRRSRACKGLCPQCGYPLPTGGPCPECGS